MLPLTPQEILPLLALSLFIIGVLTLLAGVWVLLARVVGQTSAGDIRTITNQTTELAQKGLADNLSGLVGNATNLLDAMNQMVRTAAGIGVFLIIIGLGLISASCWLIFQS